MAAAPDTIPTAVAVTHLPSAGRGQHLEFHGDDAAAVLAAAALYWSGADPWLRGERPVLRPLPDGRYAANVRVWGAA